MQMKPVESSNLDSVGYDPTEMKLRVRFNNGSEYEYDGVPQEVYDGFFDAPSVGSYFNETVKQSFPYTKL